MARIVVVADDLTGANATGGLFAEHGFSTVTLLDERGLNGALDRYDIVCLSTGSRHLDPDEASERVRRAVASGEDVSLVVKRIDTTLRGNVGAEIEAALGAAPTRRRALIVPAFPAAGRTTEGGLQLLDGVPLAETEAARDPLSPVTSSRVVDVVTGRSDLELAELTGADLRDRDALERALSSGPVGVVCDAGDDDDLAAIAAAAVAVAARTGVEWMSVDPGPFGPHLAAALGLRGSAARSRPEQPAPRLGPLVIACGSVTARTLEQLAHIEEVLAARFVHLDIAELDSRAAGTELLRLLERAPVDGVVGVRTAAAASDVRSIDGAGARRVLD
ncbi:MAG: four-carbon acid sugar kinase family protein, partial [Actinomycetota bacterium]